MTDLAEDLFIQAHELPPGERAAFLREACGDNAELQLEIQSLLVDAEHAGAFFGDWDGATLGAAQLVDSYAEQEGDVIGCYELRQQIGEGGFGTVWMAEQSAPISRMVALKVIKAGMDTRQILARFEAERQALAMMDHPNIAKIFDAGATATGRPYFVMELVKGIPITEFCDAQGLGTTERLGLFGEVCAAINHAHQKGVIHRDIKPSNVMVTLHDERPVVKAIDFGIAKATQGKLTDQTLFTRFEQFVGTPVYMSPEQASLSGPDIDTRSDIYALGILLYELLVGKPPFDSKSLISAGYEEMRRIIREVEPVKPSSRLSTATGEERTTLATVRRIEAAKLDSLVEPDLDWIVMKAIDKVRARRYETADALAQDIVRFLADEPVSATPPSAGYQFRKFAKRNRAALRFAAAIAALLTVGTSVSTWQAVRASQAERKTAETLVQVEAALAAKDLAAKEAQEIADFLGEVLIRPDPARDGRNITVAEALEVAAEKLDHRLANQPEQRRRLQSLIASIFNRLGLPEKAVPLREELSAYLEATLGPQHKETLQSHLTLAMIYAAAGRRDDGIKLLETNLKVCRRVLGPEHLLTARTMEILGDLYMAAGRKLQALELQDEVLRQRSDKIGRTDDDPVRKLNSLARSYIKSEHYDEAIELLQGILAREVKNQAEGERQIRPLRAMEKLAEAYALGGKKDEALTLH